MSSPRLLPRLLLALGALVGTLVVAEGGMRLAWSDLPSLAGLLATTSLPAGAEAPARGEQPPDCRLPPGGQILHASWTADFEGQAPPLRLWTAGDSVTMGAGVQRVETFSTALAQRLSDQTGRAVHLEDLGIQGAAYCDSVRDLHLRLDAARPDAVVLQLFADDLEKRSIYAIEGQVIAFPWREPNPALRWLASQSYLGNWAWLTVRARRADGPQRGIAVEDQIAFRRALAVLSDRLVDHAVPLVLTLLPPAGLPLCDDPELAARIDDCAWMTQDMDLIAVMLVQEGLPFVDLRAIWSELPDVSLAQERRELEDRGRLPVHPDAAGHQAIADALWPSLIAALPSGPAADGASER